MSIKLTVGPPTPTKTEVGKYLTKWTTLSTDFKQKCLDDLVSKYPTNRTLEEIYIKCVFINYVYSTNIFSIYPIAEKIFNLNIDSKLKRKDRSIVDDIATVLINGKARKLYSFATKYCSSHCPDDFPIYDKYVNKALVYFQQQDKFDKSCSKISDFKKKLKNYEEFCNVLSAFMDYYKLADYSFKEIDIYLWQLGQAL